jgi:hypothetical protein
MGLGAMTSTCPSSVDLGDDACEFIDTAGRHRAAPWAPPGAEPVRATEDVGGQSAVVAVIAMQETPFLAAMQGSVDRVQADSGRGQSAQVGVEKAVHEEPARGTGERP